MPKTKAKVLLVNPKVQAAQAPKETETASLLEEAVAPPKLGKPAVAEEVNLSYQNAVIGIQTRPDMLGHPYKTYCSQHGLDDQWAHKNNVEFYRVKGWRVFRKPQEIVDVNPIIGVGDGDFVQRGDLILMVRPLSVSNQERIALRQAYDAEVGEIKREFVEKAESKGSKADVAATIQPAQITQPAPTDQLG